LWLETYMGGHNPINWFQSYAYADSYADLPLLERVGHPVAVYRTSDWLPTSRIEGGRSSREPGGKSST